MQMSCGTWPTRVYTKDLTNGFIDAILMAYC